MDQLSAKQILQSRAVISTVGKFTVRVTNVTHGHIRENGQVVNIVNFAAMTAFQAQAALAAYKAGNYEEATQKSLSTSQLSGQYTPTKGEIVDIEVAEHFSDNVGENILVVSAIIKRQAEQAHKFSLDDVEESAPVETEKEIV